MAIKWSPKDVGSRAPDNPVLVKLDWEDDTGDGSYDTRQTPAVHGRVMRVTTIPDGDNPPTDYDLYILDNDGIDILNGQGASPSRSGSSRGQILFRDPPLVRGELTIALENQLNAGGKGKIRIYLEREEE